ncbi:MAG: UPF0175 family protein [Verrucomicrobia bacterium]|nr:UPF0175 family protein [Verrucomicrobiota bacterium]
MAELTLQYPDEPLVASGKTRSEIERELKFQLAVRLFEVGQLSLGKAAELAGWNRLLFADELGRLKIPVVNLDDEEIQAELRALRGNRQKIPNFVHEADSGFSQSAQTKELTTGDPSRFEMLIQKGRKLLDACGLRDVSFQVLLDDGTVKNG